MAPRRKNPSMKRKTTSLPSPETGMEPRFSIDEEGTGSVWDTVSVAMKHLDGVFCGRNGSQFLQFECHGKADASATRTATKSGKFSPCSVGSTPASVTPCAEAQQSIVRNR